MAYIGYQIVSADAVVGVSGDAVAVHSVQVNSGSGGAGSVILRNGTGTGGTAVYEFAGAAANALEVFTLAGGQGVVFPDGCFADIGANTDSVTVAYQKVGS